MQTRSWTRVVSFTIAIACFTMPSPSRAVDLSSGVVELAPSVSFSHSNFKRKGYGNVETFTELGITPTAGYWITEHHEVTGGVIVRYDARNGDGSTALGAMAGYTYNFSARGDVIPFASFGFGALFYEGFSFEDTAVLAPVISGGVRFLVGNSGSVNVSLGYQRESNADGQFNASRNRLVAGVGVSLFPWKTR